MLLSLLTFSGEVPAAPAHLLKDNEAQFALNCDFMHGELRGLRDNALVDTMPRYGFDTILSVWTEDGANFFGWPFDTDVVKSLVTDEVHHRIYYTGEPSDGPIIKVARTARTNANGTLLPVIGSSIVGGQYKPPEASSPASPSNPFGNNLGPDSWILGIKPPEVQAIGPADVPGIVLTDRQTWPGAPRLQLRVTYFVENPAGEIVFQQDISNSETVPGYPQIIYTWVDAERLNKIQDVMYPLLNYGPLAQPQITAAPYKYYWCEPPPLDTALLSRIVRVTNPASAAGPILIEYDGGTVVPSDPVIEGSGDGSGSGSGGDGGDA